MASAISRKVPRILARIAAVVVSVGLYSREGVADTVELLPDLSGIKYDGLAYPFVDNVQRFVKLIHLVPYIEVADAHHIQASLLPLLARTDLVPACSIIKVAQRRMRVLIASHAEGIGGEFVEQLLLPPSKNGLLFRLLNNIPIHFR